MSKSLLASAFAALAFVGIAALADDARAMDDSGATSASSVPSHQTPSWDPNRVINTGNPGCIAHVASGVNLRTAHPYAAHVGSNAYTTGGNHPYPRQ